LGKNCIFQKLKLIGGKKLLILPGSLIEMSEEEVSGLNRNRLYPSILMWVASEIILGNESIKSTSERYQIKRYLIQKYVKRLKKGETR
jgi:hypothetical protein